ncbi:MAG: leucine-rich repeat protein, partial [Bacteroidales bacterium]|nr:leucine-rich repeat protein [Bacteroidales bacterium]
MQTITTYDAHCGTAVKHEQPGSCSTKYGNKNNRTNHGGGIARRLMPLLLFVLTATAGWAYDFSYTLPCGNQIYFDVIKNGSGDIVRDENGIPTARVTYKERGLITYNGGALSDGYITQSCSTLVIPEYVRNEEDTLFHVTEIGGHAFQNCKNITSVEIPPSVTKIGTLAFSNLENLSNISLPEGLKDLAEDAFASQFLGQNITNYVPAGIDAIEFRSQEPPVMSDGSSSEWLQDLITNIFGKTNTGNKIQFTVPCGSGDAYTEVFGDAVNIVEGQVYTVTYSVNNPNYGSISKEEVTGFGGCDPSTSIIRLTAQTKQVNNTSSVFIGWDIDGDGAVDNNISSGTNPGVNSVFAVSGTNNSVLSVNVYRGDRTVTAIFASGACNVTVSAGTGGTATIASKGSSVTTITGTTSVATFADYDTESSDENYRTNYEENNYIIIKATAATGFEFHGWDTNGNGVADILASSISATNGYKVNSPCIPGE